MTARTNAGLITAVGAFLFLSSIPFSVYLILCYLTGNPKPGWVSIMLALSCEAMRLQGPQEPQAPPSGAVPLPLSAINVGQDDDNQTFLMLEVGAAALMFHMPSAALEEVGQTLLALSVCATGKPS